MLDRLAPKSSQLISSSTDQSEIIEIMSFKHIAPRSGKISTDILIASKDFILHPLSIIINRSLVEGIFPNELKTATITPLPPETEPDSTITTQFLFQHLSQRLRNIL